MMKFLKYFTGLIIVLLIAVYVLAFTSFGNGIVSPILEKKIQEQTHMDAKLQTFQLSMSDFKIVLVLTSKNIITAQGTYSLFSQNFQVAYDIALKNLSALEPLTQTPLSGALLTHGDVKGDMHFVTIDGVSDIAKSDTNYHVELTEFNPSSIIAKVNHLDLQTLLAMVGQKRYASAIVNLDANFKNITPHKLDGNVVLTTSKGVLNSKVLKHDFNITVPTTRFAMNLDAKLKGDDVTYKYFLQSNLAKISSSGTLTPQPLKVDLFYGVDVKELALLKPISGADIRGSVKLSGTVKGDKKQMNIDAVSNIASSYTKAHITLQELQPSMVVAKVKHLKVQKLLYMVKQPHYTDADIDVEAKLTNLDPKNLQGHIITHILKGKLDSAYLTKAYKFKHPMPVTRYNGVINTTIEKSVVTSQVDFNSNLVDLDIAQARFVIADSSLASDYKVNVPSLDRLYFVSDRHLRGGIVAHGDVKKAKDLDLTLLSKIAGGKLDVKLHNDDLKANLANMDTLKVLNILIYPEVFDAKVDADVKYNLASSKGVATANLKEGKFTKNVALDLTKQYAKIDLYKQHFNGDAKADIAKENIVAQLNLKSNTSSISTQNTRINTKAQTIDSKIKIIANNNPAIYVTLRGNVSQPKVAVDASSIIKHEAKKAINKEVNKLFKKLF